MPVADTADTSTLGPWGGEVLGVSQAALKGASGHGGEYLRRGILDTYQWRSARVN